MVDIDLAKVRLLEGDSCWPIVRNRIPELGQMKAMTAEGDGIAVAEMPGDCTQWCHGLHGEERGVPDYVESDQDCRKEECNAAEAS